MGACNTKGKGGQSHHAHKATEAFKDGVQTKIVAGNENQGTSAIGAVKATGKVISNNPEVAGQKAGNYKLRFTSGGENIIHEGAFTGERQLKAIVDEFKTKLDPLSDYDYWIVDASKNLRTNISQRLGEPLRVLVPADVTEKNTTVIELSGAGLKISPDTRKAYAESTSLFATPKYDPCPFELITFSKTNNGLSYQLYQDESFNYLRSFNEFSGYCNGGNKLFISGSDKKNEDDTYCNLFVEIDLANMNKPDHIRRLPNLVTGRGWHSMIFIPPCYVFIVGGINTKSVELFNTVTGELTHDSNLLEQRSETSLCCVNNAYLYAFCGFLINNNFISSIEKCNLKSRSRHWEKVNLNLAPNCIFEPSFFSIAYGKGNSIVLLGGKENQRAISKNYILECKDGVDTLDNYALNQMDDTYLCSEKFFIPMNGVASLLMPIYTSDVVKILLFDGEKNSLNIIKFEIMDTTEDEIKNSNFFQNKQEANNENVVVQQNRIDNL